TEKKSIATILDGFKLRTYQDNLLKISFYTVWAQSRPSALTYFCPKTSLSDSLFLSLSFLVKPTLFSTFTKLTY
ncbi:hypothetical protein, partial [Pseudoalteromonas sp.]|uniref:hypothetical protein n=1 Tax=Pseudoalteromonas sp. TaxID=53249 RepID=UPI003F97AB91